MRRLVVRLVLSHIVVAVLGGLTTFVLVRTLAPQLFDRELQMMQGMGAGMGRGLSLKTQFASAVTEALLIGVTVGLVTAAAFGAFAAYRLTRPLAALGVATRSIANGRYAVDVPTAGTRELDDLAGDVRTLAASLRDTEARRTRLLGEVAHEMRTPLTVIDGNLEGMVDGVVPRTPEALAALAAETRRLHRLADDLSSLSRAEEGRLVMATRRVDLCEVVSAAAERLRPQAADAEIALTIDPTSAPVLVDADADRIAQVATNLVGNALRATPAGGSVTVRVAADGPYAVATVTDTGEGIAPDDLDRVFERFYRVPGRRRPAGQGAGDGGSGIGLTIARRIAEAHGGTLTAASPGLGAGARFTVTLPLASG